jgi:hypothetical protein
VVQNTSHFTSDETAGFKEATEAERIDSVDLMSIRKNMTRFYRQESYPPLRGMCVNLNHRESLLYTNGSVDVHQIGCRHYIIQ